MPRSRTKQKQSNKGVLGFGIVLLTIGVILIFSALDLSQLSPLDLTYKGPLGELTVDSFSEDEEQRLFVGFVIVGFGLLLVKLGK